MRVLVACEFSGVVRDAFLDHGFDAWSCDLKPTESDGPHICGDVLEIVDDDWDLMIAHHPCTYLCNSGVRWLYKKDDDGNKIKDEDRWEKMRDAAAFFKSLLNAPIPHIAVENPVMHSYGIEIIGQKYDQIIQPYYFGDSAQKTTCLWLKNLPELEPTNVVDKGDFVEYSSGARMPKWYADAKKSDDDERQRLRSITFQGFAEAMAMQWGNFVANSS